MHRNVRLSSPLPPRLSVRAGRCVISVIGIDQYMAWPSLQNAVTDAACVARLFKQLGFVEVTRPLLNAAATREAMHRLVTADLVHLSSDDSLVLFFAGHGHTHTADFGDVSVKTGYVIPVDAMQPGARVGATWLRLDSWLSDIARLPPRHILVVIDACHSGVALSALHKWRDEGLPPAGELDVLQARRSRRIITAALDDQRAMDGGPYPGHSLFTGCLIEGLSGGLAEHGQQVVTGRELGQYLQKRVRSYPHSTQTPDFGAFELDDRGDIVLPLWFQEVAPEPPEPPPGLQESDELLRISAESPAYAMPPLSRYDVPDGPSRDHACVFPAVVLPALEPSTPTQPTVALAAAPLASSVRGTGLARVRSIAVATAMAIIGAGVAVGAYKWWIDTSDALELSKSPPGKGARSPMVHWKLRSTPIGAQVFDSEGRVLGTTPLDAERPHQSGPVDLVLKRDGYFDKKLTLDGAHDADRDETLVPIIDKNIKIVD